MNYLIEPYNAYQKPPKKKHWMEIAEEEALYHQIAIDQLAREQMLLKEQSALKQSQNLALLSQVPQPPSQQVQDGQFGANSGAGGVVPVDVLIYQEEQSETASFSTTPSSGVGPLTVTFLNLTFTPENDTFYWNLGSGSLTSTAINPPAVTYTQTGSYTVALQETSSTGASSSISKTITVNAPTLTAAFTVISSSANTAHKFTASFTGSVTYNSIGTLSGFWTFGDATSSAYTTNNPFTHSYTTGSYTASLAVTESLYNIIATSSNAYISQST